MALANTIKQMNTLLCQISSDLPKAEGGNKAAAQRVRTSTVKLEKIAKMYRKESIRNEKLKTGRSRPARKSTKTKAKATRKTAAAKKPAARKAAARKAPARKAAARRTTAKPAAFSFKRKQTAKLRKKRSAARR